MSDTVKNHISKTSSVGEGSTIEAPIRLYSSAKIQRNASIGRYSYMNSMSVINSNCTVGRFCSIGRNVDIGPFDHPLDWVSTSPVGYNLAMHYPSSAGLFRQTPLKRPSGAVLGNDVWVGSNSVIMRGIKVGNGAVIGAGSIVTKDVAPYSIVVGAPAKHMRFRFDKDICDELNALAWWDLPLDDLKNITFADVQGTLKTLREIRNAPPASVPEKSDDKDSMIEQLRNKIAELETKAGDTSSDTDATDRFHALIQQKLYDCEAPAILTDFLEASKLKLYTKYDLFDPYDQQILNNKIIAISELAIKKNGDPKVLSPALKKQILFIMANKQ